MLRIDVHGPRPSPSGLIIHGGGEIRSSTWYLSCSRPPTFLEAIDAGREATGGSPEWWVIPSPWRADLEPTAGDPASFILGGMFVGPVPPAQTFVVQLAVGADLAPAVRAHG